MVMTVVAPTSRVPSCKQMTKPQTKPCRGRLAGRISRPSSACVRLGVVLLLGVVVLSLPTSVHAVEHPENNTEDSPPEAVVETTSDSARPPPPSDDKSSARRAFNDPEFQRTLKEYWKQTLLEIGNMAGGGGGGALWSVTPPSADAAENSDPSTASATPSDPTSFFSQWKQLLTDDSSQLAWSLYNHVNVTTANINAPAQAAAPSTAAPPSGVNATAQEEDDTPSAASKAVVGSSSLRFGGTSLLPRRFEGFLSWERLLQEWSDEIQDYMDRVQDESITGESSEYPFSTYGRPSGTATTTTTSSTPPPRSSTTEGDEGGTEEAAVRVGARSEPASISDAAGSSTQTTSSKTALPIPAPAQPHQEVVPHTNLRDKSKRVWIVTTASLPWRTGTAVNPLLRAAYLCHGRAAKGGSVTLMLPWLERPGDQERVYGAGRGFALPADQEAFVRQWLKDSAKLPQASEELNIEWYTGWQNKVENSIYSMGDITALIPDDACDIMILEEPVRGDWRICRIKRNALYNSPSLSFCF